MKNIGKITIALIGLAAIIITVGALGLGGRYASMKVEGWFAPQEQNIQREVFENTKSYNEGKKQELIKYKFEYDKAEARDDIGTMKAVKSAVRHSFADYEDDRLSPSLREFVSKCK